MICPKCHGTGRLTGTIAGKPIGRGEPSDDIRDDAQLTLDAALSARLASRLDIPLPCRTKDLFRDGPQFFTTVSPSSTIAAKVMLWQEIRRQGLSQAEFARRMERHPQYIPDKLLDPESPTTLRVLEDAAAALGKRLVVSIE